jgi:hypothetical protein
MRLLVGDGEKDAELSRESGVFYCVLKGREVEIRDGAQYTMVQGPV